MTDVATARRSGRTRAGRELVRPRVADLLTSALQRGSVVEVVAPAGAGKSTAVVQWASTRAGTRVVDGEDPALGGAGAASTCLVVDDAHLAPVDVLTGLVNRALADPHPGLVLVSRRDLLPETYRLRVTGALVEVRTADLAFTVAEVRALAGLVVGAVDEAAAAHVVRLTGGWPVAVRLALLAAAGERAPSDALRRLGHHELDADGYLVEQVLDRLDPRLRTFVLRATVDDVVDARFAEDVTAGGALLLEECVRQRLFLEPVRPAAPHGPPRYRWNPLVAARARAIAERREPAMVAHLHRRAALHLARSRPERAFEHALRAQDPHLARDVLVGRWPDLVVADRAAAAAAMAARLPGVAADDADVRLVRSVGAPSSAGPGTHGDVCRSLVRLLDRPPRPVAPEERIALRALLDLPDGPAAPARLLVRYALARSDDGDVRARAEDLVGLASAAAAAGLPLLQGTCLVEAGTAMLGRGPGQDAAAVLREAADVVEDLDGASGVRAGVDLALGLEAVWQVRPAEARSHLLRARDARPAREATDVRRVADVTVALLGALTGGARRPHQADQVPAGPWSPVVELLRDVVAGASTAGTTAALAPTVTEVVAALQAAVHASERGRPGPAHAHLEGGLEVAAQHGAVLPLVPRDDAARRLLAAHLAWGTRHGALVRRVLTLPRAAPSDGPGALTERESEVLACLRADMSASEIAEALVVSVNTVKTHQRGLYRKLGVTDRRGAVREALRQGLVG